jgi:hypothetical protein
VPTPPADAHDERAVALRRSRFRLVTLGVVAALALLSLLYGVARRGGTYEAGSPAAQPPLAVVFNRENVVPGITCGTLDGMKLTDDGGVFLWGWAYDPRTAAPAQAVIVLDNNQALPPVPVNLERPDVAAFKGTPLLLKSGWNLRLPESWRHGHEHVLRAYAILGDHKLGPLGGELSVPVSKN